jgi:hypothetical protein
MQKINFKAIILYDSWELKVPEFALSAKDQISGDKILDYSIRRIFFKKITVINPTNGIFILEGETHENPKTNDNPRNNLNFYISTEATLQNSSNTNLINIKVDNIVISQLSKSSTSYKIKISGSLNDIKYKLSKKIKTKNRVNFLDLDLEE